jgi:hypothetical protein
MNSLDGWGTILMSYILYNYVQTYKDMNWKGA